MKRTKGLPLLRWMRDRLTARRRRQEAASREERERRLAEEQGALRVILLD